MKPELEELAVFIKRNVPRAREIRSFTVHEDTTIITFQWHERDFAVKPSLEVFEVKVGKILLTGSSLLLQTIFTKQRKNQRVAEAVIDSIRRAEDLFKAENTEQAFALLGTVESTLVKLLGHPPEKKAQPSPPVETGAAQ